MDDQNYRKIMKYPSKIYCNVPNLWIQFKLVYCLRLQSADWVQVEDGPGCSDWRRRAIVVINHHSCSNLCSAPPRQIRANIANSQINSIEITVIIAHSSVKNLYTHASYSYPPCIYEATLSSKSVHLLFVVDNFSLLSPLHQL